MANSDLTTVDAYLAAQPEAAQRALIRVRQAIRRAVPEADELISYKIPAFKFRGRPLMFFAGWARHYSVYPAGSMRVLAKFKTELAGCVISRGTIRFALSDPVPVGLIGRMAKFRAAEISAAEKLKADESAKRARRSRSTS